MARFGDGSAGDTDYAAIAPNYSAYRRPDPRIAAHIEHALGAARTVLNVGAGAGSYEPMHGQVTAVEPSASMRAQRPEHLSRTIDAVAEALPFPDQAFDASMATFTVHQWSDLERGLAELRRVTRGPVVVLTCDPAWVQHFWLNDYAPEVLAMEAKRYPSLAWIKDAFGKQVEVRSVPIPLDCRDGFNEAYYGRPENLLEEGARLACSAWSLVPDDVHRRSVENLRRDIADGKWDSMYGHLRLQPVFEGSLRLIVAWPGK
jgi:SAM-dependent methyltransferase